MTDTHKQARVEFCEWLLEQPDGFPNSVFFSDEKTFEKRTRPNCQNERYWANVDPGIEDENRVQGGRKVCAGLVLLMVGLFFIGLMKDKEKTNTFICICYKLWFGLLFPLLLQEGGTGSNKMVRLVLDLLASKFGNCVISNLTDRVWPPRSPDLSPLDFWFWGICLSELRRSPPNSIEELKETINTYASCFNPKEIRKAVCHIIPRAKYSILANGTAFEQKLKKTCKDIEE